MSFDAVSYSSDFVPSRTLSVSAYSEFAHGRSIECINLFEGYKTHLLRCEIVDEASLNVRWKAEWIPSGSTWLYDLADFMKWAVTTKSPDPMSISVFSWRSVFDTFQEAFATGMITLPISFVRETRQFLFQGNLFQMSLLVYESN